MIFNSYNKFVYKQYLVSPHYKNLAKKALKMAMYKCEKCSSIYGLKCYHRNFDNLYRETLDDLIILCDQCYRKDIARF
jgi:hypothetical protein